MEDGEEVLDPSTGQVYGNFIAFFLGISRTSRKEAMRIGRETERRVRDHTDGFWSFSFFCDEDKELKVQLAVYTS